MKRIKFTIFSLLFFLLFSTVFPNGPIILASDERGDREGYELYEVLETIVLDEDISLERGSLVYGKKESEQISIDYNESEYWFGMENFTEADISNNKPIFIDNDSDLMYKEILLTNSFIIGQSSIDKSTVRVIGSHYNRVYDHDGVLFIIIGNIAYNITLTNDREDFQEPEENNNETILDDELTPPDEGRDNNLDQSEEKIVSEEPSPEETQSGEEALDKPSKDLRKVDPSDEEKTNDVSEETIEPQLSRSKSVSMALNIWNDNINYFKVLDMAIPIYESKNGSLVKVGEVKGDQVYKSVGMLGDWHIIQFGNTKGYVWSKSTQPASKSEIKNPNDGQKNINKFFTAKQHVVVYDNSSGTMEAFGAISKDVRYPVLSDTGNWIKVILGDRIGYVYKQWVKMDFTSKDSYFKVLDHAIPIYESQDGSLVKVGEVKGDQVYPRIGVLGDWHIIQFGNTKGYVWSKSTQPASKTEINNPSNGQKSNNTFFTAKQHVVVYDNSSGSMEAFGAISENVRYPILSDTGNWIKVILGDRIGYVYKEWIRLDFKDTDKAFKVDVDNVPVYHRKNGTLVTAGHLTKNEIYLREGSKGSWHIIDFGNDSGYVWLNSTSPASTNSLKNINNKQNTDSNVIAKNTVIVYDNTNGFKPFAKIMEGTVYPLLNKQRVGNWYEVSVGGRYGYVYHTGMSSSEVKRTAYNITLNDALSIQLGATPQTDKEYNSYVSKEFIDRNHRVTASTLNVRGAASTNGWVIGKLNKGDKVTVIKEMNGWYQIRYTESRQWVNPSPNDLLYYLDPENFVNNATQKFQFLDLSRSNVATVSVLNRYLENKGILAGKAQAFNSAGIANGINEVYLVSHATLETGNGTSTLARGVPVDRTGKVTRDRDGKISKTSATYKTVYNMYGYGAYDSCPIECGAKYAFDNGWFTPESSIIGGAADVAREYINSDLNTLYKMRWNPLAMELTGKYGKQYATDIGWASKQVNSMYNIYQQLGSYMLFLDVPVYKK